MPIWCGDGTPGIHLPGSNIVIAEECHHSYESAAKTKTINAATGNSNHRVIPNRIECNMKWKDPCKMIHYQLGCKFLHHSLSSLRIPWLLGPNPFLQWKETAGMQMNAIAMLPTCSNSWGVNEHFRVKLSFLFWRNSLSFPEFPHFPSFEPRSHSFC